MSNWNNFQELVKAVKPAENDILQAKEGTGYWGPSFENSAYKERLVAIAEKHHLSIVQVEGYSDILDLNTVQTAIIYLDEQKLFGEPCFGVSYDRVPLPEGAVVIGFMLRQKQAVLASVMTNAKQREQLEDLVANALIVVGAWAADFEKLMNENTISLQ